MRTTPCRACSAPIGFIEMPTGSHMPVDPELVQTYILEPIIGHRGKPITLITERGAVVKGVQVSFTVGGAEAVEGFVPHWKSCTKPASFRRPKMVTRPGPGEATGG